MMSYRNLLVVCALSVTAGLAVGGCGQALDDGNAGQPRPEGGPVSVPDFGGKADNYVGTNSREFELTGTAEAPMPEEASELEGEARQEAIREAIDDRLSTVARAIEDRVEDVIDEANEGQGDLDKGEGYFMVARNDNEKILDWSVSEDGESISAKFEWEFVGNPDMIGLLVEGGEGSRSFEVEIEAVEPDAAGTEMLTVDVAPSPSDDAFPKYDELFADGVYDIGVHFGGDYNDERYDLEMAEWAVDKLRETGWSNPEVGDFDDLTIDSPPFTKEMSINGETVVAKVYLYHPGMPKDGPQSKQKEKLRESFAERDVVMYNGHAGPGAGFILDYEPSRYEVKPRDFDELPLAEKYQIYVINGCETYASYVPDLMKNERKTFENVDIVTTVNKTPIASFDDVTWRFLRVLTMTDRRGGHYPLTWNKILQGVNKGNREKAKYGVHGIDQDPELNPHASEGIACTSCDGQGQCGAGGNYCLRMRGGGRCGVACATSDACGEGSECVPVTDDADKFYLPKQCMPSTRQCTR